MPESPRSSEAAPAKAPTADATPAPEHPAWPPRLRAHALLAAAQAGPGDRVLILGATGAPELICAALARGCLSAASLKQPPSRPEPSDVVLLPTTPETLPALLACARQALGGCARGGRLALRLAGSSARSGSAAIAASLARLGFEQINLRRSRGGEALLTCRLRHHA